MADNKKLKVEPSNTVIILDPKTKRRFVVDVKCRCGHLYNAHMKDGQVRGCTSCVCTAFDSLKVHYEVAPDSLGIYKSLAALIAIYLFTMVFGAIWWKGFLWVLARLP